MSDYPRRRLGDLAGPALRALADVMRDQAAPIADRRRAARSLLDRGVSGDVAREARELLEGGRP